MRICIGIGPGNLDYLTQRGLQLIQEAEVISGFQTVLDFARTLFPKDVKEIPLSYKTQVDRLKRVAEEHQAGKRCVIVFMGDIHFSGFQMLERVEIACGHPVETVPGISSSQILASKAKVCFDETTFLTLHRRGEVGPFLNHLIHVLEDDRNAIVIPRPWDWMPKDIAKFLLEKKVSSEYSVEVWENLTKNEAAWKGTLGDCIQEFSDMSIMLIRALNPMPSQL